MKCKVQNCFNEYYLKGYCQKHYAQMYKFGYIRERTIRDPNEFVIEGNMSP